MDLHAHHDRGALRRTRHRRCNLALGKRRAGAVRDYLVSLGVEAERLAVISKGKEAPVWAK